MTLLGTHDEIPSPSRFDGQITTCSERRAVPPAGRPRRESEPAGEVGWLTWTTSQRHALNRPDQRLGARRMVDRGSGRPGVSVAAALWRTARSRLGLATASGLVAAARRGACDEYSDEQAAQESFHDRVTYPAGNWFVGVPTVPVRKSGNIKEIDGTRTCGEPTTCQRRRFGEVTAPTGQHRGYVSRPSAQAVLSGCRSATPPARSRHPCPYYRPTGKRGRSCECPGAATPLAAVASFVVRVSVDWSGFGVTRKV